MPDVIVVGGGIIGAACAYELTRAGAAVTLIEKEELAYGASGRNQGLWLLPDAPECVEMARRSLAMYLDAAPKAPLAVHLDREPYGLVLAATAPEDLDAPDAVGVAADAGARVERLNASELHTLEPALADDLPGGWFVHDGHRLDPAALTVGLALLAADSGATIRHHVGARALVDEGERVTGVVTDDGVLKADEVVIAAGPWSPLLLQPVGVRLPVNAARGWLVRVRPATPPLGHLVEAAGWRGSVERWSAVRNPSAGDIAGGGLPTAELGPLLHPHDDGTVLIGSSRQAWLTPEPEDRTSVQRLLQAGIRLVPALADAEVLHAWWGLRPMSPDDRPFVGRVRDGLVVATGHGSEGVILGGGSAEVVRAAIVGDAPPFDPAPFDPLRAVR
jgi:D-hydroxyproline dehydrogenase subunit beta